MSTLAIGLATVLTAIAALHLYWGFGGLWPAASEADLVKTVVGAPGRRRMPGRAVTLVVATCLLGGAVCGVMLRWPASFLPGGLVALAGTALALVFGLRGVAGYMPVWRRALSAEPFSRLDRSLYSPLCLLLGTGFALLSYLRWSAP